MSIEALAKQEQRSDSEQLGEPVAWRSTSGTLCNLLNAGQRESGLWHPLYTTPQRTWVGLTDREKSNLWLESRAAIPRFYTYASLVEAKLRSKNERL